MVRTARRMVKTQSTGMKKRPLECIAACSNYLVGYLGQSLSTSVYTISDYRMVYGRQVNANLVCPPCFN